MKKLIAIIALTSALFAANSNACSVMPLDPNVTLMNFNLEPVAVSALGITQDRVTDISVSDVDANYVWSNPMCPEGVTAEGTFTVSFASTDPLSRGCTGVVKIKRTVADEVNAFGVKKEAINNFKIDVVQTPICLELL